MSSGCGDEAGCEGCWGRSRRARRLVRMAASVSLRVCRRVAWCRATVRGSLRGLGVGRAGVDVCVGVVFLRMPLRGAVGSEGMLQSAHEGCVNALWGALALLSALDGDARVRCSSETACCVGGGVVWLFTSCPRVFSLGLAAD